VYNRHGLTRQVLIVRSKYDLKLEENWGNPLTVLAQQSSPVLWALRISGRVHNRDQLKAVTKQVNVLRRKSALLALSMWSKESVSLGNASSLSVPLGTNKRMTVNRCSFWTCPKPHCYLFLSSTPLPTYHRIYISLYLSHTQTTQLENYILLCASVCIILFLLSRNFIMDFRSPRKWTTLRTYFCLCMCQDFLPLYTSASFSFIRIHNTVAKRKSNQNSYVQSITFISRLNVLDYTKLGN